MKTAILTAIFLQASTLSAAQASEDYSRSYEECLRDSGSIRNTSVAGCAESVSERAKTEMNSLYKSIFGQYQASSPDNASQLEKAQKAWLTYRSLHCDLAGQNIGSPMYYVCPMNMNIQRVDELRALSGR